MICDKCETENNISSKFCKKCGSDLLKSNMGSVDFYFHKRDNQCYSCKEILPVRYIKFYQNIGLLIQRRYGHIEGNMCRECIDRYFWEYTLKTLVLGWWGTISFFITPFYLLNNIGRYITTLNLKNGVQQRIYKN